MWQQRHDSRASFSRWLSWGHDADGLRRAGREIWRFGTEAPWDWLRRMAETRAQLESEWRRVWDEQMAPAISDAATALAARLRGEGQEEAMSQAAKPDPARVVIENVQPSVDAGRHPVKRTVGDRLEITADIYKDGHDLISARARFRAPGDRVWQEAPLRYEFDPDRWVGEVALDRTGRWCFTVDAWPDRFGTWQSELRKRVDAGQEVSSELLEGAVILARAAERVRRGKARLEEAVATVGDTAREMQERIEAALADDLAELADVPLENAERTRFPTVFEVVVERERARFSSWYELFPRSQASEPGRHGTFADAARRIPELAELGFDVIYLPPIHPIGRSHRKGANNSPSAEPGEPGSPWAIGGPEGGHTEIHPELGTVDDFVSLVETAKHHDMEIAIDWALQCSPDHPWVKEHPEWFFRRPDGTIHYAENPPKKYQDIYPLNFWCKDREALWEACRDALLLWVERGVKIFRVDNPHTKPLSFWEWCIREVQDAHPDVIFLSEAFTRPKRMLGLAKLGFSQSYTYFTWKNRSWELAEFMHDLTQTGVHEFYRPNFFANTPDILHEYLQKGGRPAFRVRLLLAATLAPNYGIYSGFELCENVAVREGSEEYLDSEKYQIKQRDWNAPGHIKREISLVNRIRREEPALQHFENLEILGSENPEVFWFWKRAVAGGSDLLVAANLDPFGPQDAWVEVPIAELGIAPAEEYVVEDLLGGERYTWSGHRNYVRLDPSERPGHVFRIHRRASAPVLSA